MTEPSAHPDPSSVTYSAALSSLAAWGLKLPDIIAIASLLVAVAGLLAQVYYVWLVKRAMEQHPGKPPPDSV